MLQSYQVKRAIKFAVEHGVARWFSGASMATIFMLHRIGRLDHNRLCSNEQLKISPEFLDTLILDLKLKGFAFISIAELYEVLRLRQAAKRLIVFTVDDGYQDAVLHGLPVFRSHAVPFILYVSTAMIEKNFHYWWYALEDYLLQRDVVQLRNGKILKSRSRVDKERAFIFLRELIIKSGSEGIADFPTAMECKTTYQNLALSWEQIRALQQEPLVTIGSHTHSHTDLAVHTPEQALVDIQSANSFLQDKADIVAEHFCYPFGDRISEREIHIVQSAGFKTAVTSRQGNIYAQHVNNLLALPRVFVSELNYPDRSYYSYYIRSHRSLKGWIT